MLRTIHEGYAQEIHVRLTPKARTLQWVMILWWTSWKHEKGQLKGMDQQMQAHIQRSQLTGSRHSATSKRLHGAESPFSPLHLLICFHKKNKYFKPYTVSLYWWEFSARDPFSTGRRCAWLANFLSDQKVTIVTSSGCRNSALKQGTKFL